MLPGWTRSLADAVALADRSDVRAATTPRNAGASNHVGSDGAHFGHTIPIHADGNCGRVGAWMRGKGARNSEGVTSRVVLPPCADGYSAIAAVNAVHHETYPTTETVSRCHKKAPENKSRASGARCGRSTDAAQSPDRDQVFGTASNGTRLPTGG